MSWQKHLAMLRRGPKTHWHRCEADNLCGIAPVVINERCRAACRLVCHGAMPERVFLRNTELLELVVENVLAARGASLEDLLTEKRDDTRSHHPQVQAAIEHINRRLADHRVTVASIARDLGTSSSYLGHLFAEQVGRPMHCYITERRIELAKKLLKTTDWQVKRVAYESGHSNSDWFSQVFRGQVGMTPTEYRHGNVDQ